MTFAAVFLPVYAIFGGILILVKDTSVFWHYIFEASFVKHGLKLMTKTTNLYNKNVFSILRSLRVDSWMEPTEIRLQRRLLSLPQPTKVP